MKKRLFIAIKLNQATIDSLVSFQNELRKALPYKGIRWVDPSLFHLTLQFLGDTEASQFSTLTANLNSAVSTCHPFELAFEGGGFFGSPSDIRAIWAGTETSSALRSLFNEVIHSTSFLEVDQQARFSPHLTLARGANWLSKEECLNIAKVITEKHSREFGMTKVSSFELLESILNTSGPVYKTMKIFNLE